MLKAAPLSWEVSQTLSLPMVLNPHQFYRRDWSERRLFGALPRTSRRSRWSLVSDVGSALRHSPRLLTPHAAPSLASLSALAPSLLPLRSSLLRHATTCCGSSSYGAFIISLRQISPPVYLFDRLKTCYAGKKTG